MATLLGSLLARLGLDMTEFRDGLSVAEKELKASTKRIEKIGRSISDIGQKLSLAVTVPLTGIAAGIVKVSADFEAGMGRIQIATQATGTEMRAMNDLALEIGKSSVFGASEAAGAMEMLAKAGIDTKTILGGAAKAVTDLAAAAGSELDPAASAISDSMTQFKLSAKDLPTIVNQITGAVNESKFEFGDFIDGMAQGGGVAASAGLSFKDFAATLAATSSQFASGSDAGTSLKTFLLALVPTTKKAASAMAEYGLTFFDAQGKMKSTGDIAEMLQRAFKGVSDEQRNAALKDIFGTDAIRTAVGLINQGGEGIARVNAQLASTNAGDQAAARMKGFNGQLDQLKGSLETLAIKIGQSGILETLTKIVTAVSGFIDRLSTASPGMLNFAVIVGTIVAAFGPVVVAIGYVVESCAGMLAAFGALSGGLGFIGALETAFWAVVAAVSTLGAPVVAVVAALVAAGAAIYANWDKIAPVFQRVSDAVFATLGPMLTGLIANAKAAFDEIMGSSAVQEIVEFAEVIGNVELVLLKAFGGAIPGIVRALAGVITGAINVIIDVLRIVIDLLSGDWAGAWAAAQDLAKHFVGMFMDLFGGLAQAVIGFIGGMVRGIQDWLGNKLTAIFDGVRDKIEKVKNYFFDLYDQVIGHSYIPDMVDGIAAQMARLDSVMVDKAGKTTAATKAAFEKLAADLRPLLDRLIPEARALIDYRNDLATIDKGEKAGAIDPATAELARRRLGGLGDDPYAVTALPELEPIVPALDKIDEALGGLKKKAEITTVAIAKSFKDMADATIGAIDRVASAIKGGGFLDILGAVIGLGTQLASIGAFGKTIQTRINTPAGTPPIAGARALGGPVSSGRSYLVGERGPELFTPGRNGGITSNRQLKTMGGGGNVYHISGNLLTPEFFAMIQRGDQAAAAGGAQGGARLLQRQRSRSLAG